MISGLPRAAESARTTVHPTIDAKTRACKGTDGCADGAPPTLDVLLDVAAEEVDGQGGGAGLALPQVGPDVDGGKVYACGGVVGDEVLVPLGGPIRVWVAGVGGDGGPAGDGGQSGGRARQPWGQQRAATRLERHWLAARL